LGDSPAVVDDVRDGAEARRLLRERLHGRARRHIHALRRGGVPGRFERLDSGGLDLLVEIGEQDFAAGTDPTRDRLPDPACPDDHHDVCHDLLPGSNEHGHCDAWR
jgi:hypothetical protein